MHSICSKGNLEIKNLTRDAEKGYALLNSADNLFHKVIAATLDTLMELGTNQQYMTFMDA